MCGEEVTVCGEEVTVCVGGEEVTVCVGGVSTVWVCPLMDCCDGEAPHNKVQVAFPVCCGNPIERNQVWGGDKAMHPQQGAV